MKHLKYNDFELIEQERKLNGELSGDFEACPWLCWLILISPSWGATTTTHIATGISLNSGNSFFKLGQQTDSPLFRHIFPDPFQINWHGRHGVTEQEGWWERTQWKARIKENRWIGTQKVDCCLIMSNFYQAPAEKAFVGYWSILGGKILEMKKLQIAAKYL